MIQEKFFKQYDLSKNNLVVVDAGCKGGIFSLGKIDEYIKSYGFEPDPFEFEKLIKALNGKQNNDQVNLYNEALSDSNGQADFFLTRNSSYNSILCPDLENYSYHMK